MPDVISTGTISAADTLVGGSSSSAGSTSAAVSCTLAGINVN
jgi:hypothetical protein